MDLRKDFINLINFVVFSQHDAEQIRNTAREIGFEADIIVTDEDMVSQICRQKAELGVKVFLFYGMDSRLTELGRDICSVFLAKSTVDFIKTGFRKNAFKKVKLLLYNGEYADCGLLKELWDVKVESFNVSVSESAREKYFSLCERDTLFIGPENMAYYVRQKGFNYKSTLLSAESLNLAVSSACKIISVKKFDEDKNKLNELRLEQYKVVFNFTNDAILAIDENGIIIAANDMVYKFLKHDINDRLEGKHIYNVIKGSKMIKAMYKDGGDIGDVFELPYGTVLTHRIPIEINGVKKGVVSTFQDLAVLQEHEKNARLSFMRNKKGFFAKYGFDDIKGSSAVLNEVKNVARSYAFSDSTVLIFGETGTGKELFAQSIHNASRRCNGPFVAVNCAAIPKNLLEAEFFGYDEGSFTGAIKGGKMGVFEMAHMGTIFLDEIGDMPLEMQVQLLRVIQEKEIRRIGSDRVIPVDVRVIAATNRDLNQEVIKGNFREDLFYRLDVLELKIPPLRNRMDDIDIIAVDFLKANDYKNFKSNEALWREIINELKNYDMRGNVRELQNMLERLTVMMKNSHINATALFSEISRSLSFKTQNQSDDQRLIYGDVQESTGADQWEKGRIIKALKNNGLSRTKAAKELGISRSTLWNKMKLYNIKL